MFTRRSPSSTSVIASSSANSEAATPSATAPADALAMGVEFTSSRLGKSSSHCRTFFDAFASRKRGPMIGSVPS